VAIFLGFVLGCVCSLACLLVCLVEVVELRNWLLNFACWVVVEMATKLVIAINLHPVLTKENQNKDIRH